MEAKNPIGIGRGEEEIGGGGVEEKSIFFLLGRARVGMEGGKRMGKMK